MTVMTDEAQRTTWLEWEAELRAAVELLRERPEHADVVRFLEHQITVASHNAYCGTPTPFQMPGVPAR
jgi:hypothetical protein